MNEGERYTTVIHPVPDGIYGALYFITKADTVKVFEVTRRSVSEVLYAMADAFRLEEE